MTWGGQVRGKRMTIKSHKQAGMFIIKLRPPPPHAPTGVHAPLTPSQRADAGPSYLTTGVLAVRRAGVEPRRAQQTDDKCSRHGERGVSGPAFLPSLFTP